MSAGRLFRGRWTATGRVDFAAKDHTINTNLLTSERNKYFDLVKRRKLDPSKFKSDIPEPRAKYGRGQNPVQVWEPALRVTHESGLYFEVHDTGLPGYPDRREYQCYWSTYEPAQMKVTSVAGNSGHTPVDGKTALRLFDEWLVNEVVKYEAQMAALSELRKRESETPDLWAIAYALGPSPSRAANVVVTTEQVRDTIRLLSEYIIDRHAPTAQQTEVVERNLGYLADDLPRRPTTDWRGIIIGTLVNIAVALYLNNDQGRRLFEFTKQLFGRLSAGLLN